MHVKFQQTFGMCVKGSICWKQMSQWVSVSPPLLCAPRRSASLHTPLGLTVPCRRAERERAPAPLRPREISPRFSCSVFFPPSLRLRFNPCFLAWVRIYSAVSPDFSYWAGFRAPRLATAARDALKPDSRVYGAETCRSVDGYIVTVETFFF